MTDIRVKTDTMKRMARIKNVAGRQGEWDVSIVGFLPQRYEATGLAEALHIGIQKSMELERDAAIPRKPRGPKAAKAAEIQGVSPQVSQVAAGIGEASKKSGKADVKTSTATV